MDADVRMGPLPRSSLLKRMAASWSGPRVGPTEYKVAARGSRTLGGLPSVRFAYLLARPDTKKAPPSKLRLRQGHYNASRDEFCGMEWMEKSSNETGTEAIAGFDDEPCAEASPLPRRACRRRAKAALPQACRPQRWRDAVAELMELQADLSDMARYSAGRPGGYRNGRSTAYSVRT